MCIKLKWTMQRFWNGFCLLPFLFSSFVRLVGHCACNFSFQTNASATCATMNGMCIRWLYTLVVCLAIKLFFSSFLVCFGFDLIWYDLFTQKILGIFMYRNVSCCFSYFVFVLLIFQNENISIDSKPSHILEVCLKKWAQNTVISLDEP